MRRHRYIGLAAARWGAGLVLVGIVAMAWAWRGAAAILFVPTQVAFIVSGWVTGLLLVVLGLAVLRSLLNRIVEAEHAHRLEDLLDAFDRVTELSRSDPE